MIRVVAAIPTESETAAAKNAVRVRVADHRVQGVHGLVGQSAGRSPQEAVEHRGDDAVASVLRDRLDSRPDDLVRGEMGRVAPDELPDADAGRYQIPAL